MKYELKSISVWAFLKISFFVNMIAGFIFGIFVSPFVSVFSVALMALFRSRGMNIGGDSSIETIILATPFIMSFSFAFVLTFFEIIVILIYNLFAKLLGGITINLVPEGQQGLPPQTQNAQKPTLKTKSQIAPLPPIKDSIKNSDMPPPPLRVLNVQKDVTSNITVKKDVENKMTDKPVRVRIAPSPSGYLHVGTARMAIANFLYARHTGGQFLIRIENTDAARSDNSLIEPIISALKWLGIESDEKIVFQSDRIEMYKKFAQQILDNKNGYRCFCSPELLATDREEAVASKGALRYNRRCLHLTQEEIDKKIANGEKFAIRIQIPDGITTFNDIVSSDLKRENKEIEDFIIARSDGTATYNLAVVIDDHDMKISHVVRGNDHITNTFKQIHIYNALGFELPVFGHVPLILRPDKKKVSKRLGDKDVAQYREEGILPEAMFNFLCLLGWSPKTDREIYTVSELIEIFNPNNFNNSNAIFNEDKLEAFNKEHIALMSDEKISELVAPLLVQANVVSQEEIDSKKKYLCQVVSILKTRTRRVSDFVELSRYFFSSDFVYDEKAEAKNFGPEAVDLLNQFSERLEKIDSYSKETIEKALSEFALEKEIKKGQVIHPTRLAVSGIPNGPGLYDLLLVLGQETVVSRMKRAAMYIQNKGI